MDFGVGNGIPVRRGLQGTLGIVLRIWNYSA